MQGLPSEGVKGVLEYEKDQLEEVELGSVENATEVRKWGSGDVSFPTGDFLGVEEGERLDSRKTQNPFAYLLGYDKIRAWWFCMTQAQQIWTVFPK